MKYSEIFNFGYPGTPPNIAQPQISQKFPCGDAHAPFSLTFWCSAGQQHHTAGQEPCGDPAHCAQPQNGCSTSRHLEGVFWVAAGKRCISNQIIIVGLFFFPCCSSASLQCVETEGWWEEGHKHWSGRLILARLIVELILRSYSVFPS